MPESNTPYSTPKDYDSFFTPQNRPNPLVSRPNQPRPRITVATSYDSFQYDFAARRDYSSSNEFSPATPFLLDSPFLGTNSFSPADSYPPTPVQSFDADSASVAESGPFTGTNNFDSTFHYHKPAKQVKPDPHVYLLPLDTESARPLPTLPPGSPEVKFAAISAMIRQAKLSPLDYALYLFEPSPDNVEQLARWYKEPTKMHALLDHIASDDSGDSVLNKWIESRDDILCDTVSCEMDHLTTALRETLESTKGLSPAFLRNWSLERVIVQPVKKHAPKLLSVIQSAITTQRSRDKNKKKDSDIVSCDTSTN